jgi:hypothetical protein
MMESEKGTTPGGGTPAGRIIESKYRLGEPLGAGGMGTVYRATRLLIGDAVAVKLLHPGLISDTQATERFRREAQAAARLKHPNAVSVYDFGVAADGTVYLVMELVEGESLRRLIRRQGPLAPAAAVDIARQVCAALEEAHGCGVVHRDVKPDNIVVAETAAGLCVKVLDFGIARIRDLSPAAGTLTQTGMMVGTPHYMSPEQCMGEELDHRSDIYSLGVVLYEMLAGVVPFNSPTPTAVAVQHATQPPPPLRAINMGVPAAVESAILRALAKRREARPQTAAAFAQELTEAVSEGTLLRGSVAAAARPAPPVSDSGALPTVVLNPAAGQGFGGRAVGVAAAYHGGAPPPAKRSVLPWLGGVLLGAIVAGVAVALVLGGGGPGRAGGEAARVESSRNISDANLQHSLAPQAAGPRPAETARPANVERPASESRPVVDVAAVERGVRACLEGWASATRNHDFETHMSFYADTLDFYYGRRNAGVALLRADRGRTFTRYHTLDVQLSKVVVTPDPSGQSASATYDKSWNFSGDKYFSGSVRQMVTLGNFGGRWLITGEKDLQVYYVNR